MPDQGDNQPPLPSPCSESLLSPDLMVRSWLQSPEGHGFWTPEDSGCFPRCLGWKYPLVQREETEAQFLAKFSPLGSSRPIPKKSKTVLLPSLEALMRYTGGSLLLWEVLPCTCSRGLSHHCLCGLCPWNCAVPNLSVLWDGLALGLVGKTTDLEASLILQTFTSLMVGSVCISSFPYISTFSLGTQPDATLLR